jgi:hypothetical protein
MNFHTSQRINGKQNKSGSDTSPNQNINLALHIGILNDEGMSVTQILSAKQLIRQVTKKPIGNEISIGWTKNDHVKDVITHKKSNGCKVKLQ